MRQRELDLALLRGILSPGNEPELSAYEKAAFEGMLAGLVSGPGITSEGYLYTVASRLTSHQRRWATDVATRLQPIDVSKVPRGREVAEPEALRVKPLKPPGRVS